MNQNQLNNFDQRPTILRKLWNNRGGILGFNEIKQSVDNLTRQKISDNTWDAISEPKSVRDQLLFTLRENIRKKNNAEKTPSI